MPLWALDDLYSFSCGATAFFLFFFSLNNKEENKEKERSDQYQSGFQVTYICITKQALELA